MQKLLLLLAAALVLPAVWGLLVHGLMLKLWPAARRAAPRPREAEPHPSATDFWDYQI